MTVPILHDPTLASNNEIESLCYEVHGESDAYFNLISDECTSVNAYYDEVVTPSPSIDLNVMSRIGVRAKGNSRCWNISIDLEDCAATVDGSPLLPGSFDGIAVRAYATSSRVRISVPNCVDTMLVMWVYCKSGRVKDPDDSDTYYNIEFIRFVVMRGLNLNERSHGLIGTYFHTH